MPELEIRSREEVTESIFNTVQRVYGVDDPSREFAVKPAIVQELERKIKQSNAFLNQIRVAGKPTLKGQIVSMEGTQPLAKRTQNGRRPSDPTAFVDRDFENVDVEKDAVISWLKVDEWRGVTKNGDIYTEYRDIITHTNATDTLKIGWNGQFHAANTDPAAFPFLQDVHQGWIQYLIEHAPERVLGITPDSSDPRGYVIDPIKIGPGGDFISLDQLVYHVRQRFIDRLYRRRGDMRVLIGDDLTVEENKHLFGVAMQPTERNALKEYLKSQNFGRTTLAESDEFPERGIFMTPLKNIARYYEMGTMRRKLNDNDHERKGIVDYNFIREDYVIEMIEACAMVHPDALYMFDEDEGNWKPALDSWKVGGALRPDSIDAEVDPTAAAPAE